MSFKDFVDSVNMGKEIAMEAPVFGDAMLNKNNKKKPFIIVVRFKICHMSDPLHLGEAETIFTTSLECENMLRKVGDICVFKEESNFSKDGEYCIVIKYAECIKNPEADAESEDTSPK